jgi:uncharacterized membrane protein SpoIIM required for sporulation
MLEQIYPVKLLEDSPLYALLLGIGYSIIGIGLAVILFPEDPALVAVALISIMLYPTINSLMRQEESIETEKEEFNVFVFLKDHKSVFIIYLLLFMGMILTFSFFALLLPSLATNHIFENQINVLYHGSTGGAVFQKEVFSDIFRNNIVVLTVIFITAFVIGDGGIFLLVWNASVWGTIFGNLAKTAAFNSNNNPLFYFFLVLLIVTPHMLLEAFAYIASATTGGVISKAVIHESLLSKRFNYIMTNTVISIIFALIVLVIAVCVETYVLGNVGMYQEIIRQSFKGL